MKILPLSALALAAPLLVLPTAAAQGVAFAPRADYELSRLNPRQARLADLDQDGDLDLVSTSSGDHDTGIVNVLRNDGHGDLSDNDVTVAAGAHPWALEVAELTGDGVLDLAVGDSGSGTSSVHVFRGLGDGSFAAHATLQAGSFPIGIAAADLDGNGTTDLAVASNVSYGVTVFLASAPGVFGQGAHVPGVGSLHATRIAAGDVDGDQDVDLAVSHYNGVRLLHNDGAGGFSSAGGVASALTESLRLGDLDGDGDLDLAWVELYASRLGVALNDGAGHFAPVPPLATGGFPRDVAIADLDLDGRADLAVPCESNDRLSVWLGTGGGAFAAPLHLTTGWQPVALAVGDLDGDLLPDLVAPWRNLGDTPWAAVFLQLQPQPQVYCSAKASSAGCVPAIAWSGLPSASAPAPFLVSASEILGGQLGVLIHAPASAALPFQGGTLCLAPPVLRTPAQASGGGGPSSCTGAFAFDFNAWLQGGGSGVGAGDWVHAQYWYRDPADPFGSGLTDALRFLITP